MAFSQCTHGEHDKCPGQMVCGGYFVVCNCPCHSGRPVPKNPCKRCGGTGYHGPVAVEGGICFRCGGSGEEPVVLNRG